MKMTFLIILLKGHLRSNQESIQTSCKIKPLRNFEICQIYSRQTQLSSSTAEYIEEKQPENNTSSETEFSFGDGANPDNRFA